MHIFLHNVFLQHSPVGNYYKFKMLAVLVESILFY